MSQTLTEYPALLRDIKARIQGAQTRAAAAANRELVLLYWEVGRLIVAKQQSEGWGASVTPRLARDLASELPGMKGFSERNLDRMVLFFKSYQQLTISPQAVAKLDALSHGSAERGARESPPISPQAVAKIASRSKVPQPVAQYDFAHYGDAFFALPWGHHFVLIEKVKDLQTRRWYLERAVAEGWSRDVLTTMIKSQAHTRQGAAITNFAQCLPPPQSDLAQQTLKDPYIFDFLTLTAPFRERELEAHLLTHLQRFLIELGVGFAFVGRQYRLTLDGDDFYLDLLFYHLKLRCFVVVDLKVGPFQAEHAGKMNLYLNLVDERLRHPDDQPSIGLILCQDKKQLLAEYALRGLDKPIGVSEYELTRALPKELESALPTIEAIEAELSEPDEEKAT
ncbi:MAG: PDDEXK nuclease domain-containing protein [Myxococcales bacterium]|nr:PDDEXK nuclease domain-containing protein [Myxococcales bacterium]